MGDFRLSELATNATRRKINTDAVLTSESDTFSETIVGGTLAGTDQNVIV
jgi:hypothetical protein